MASSGMGCCSTTGGCTACTTTEASLATASDATSDAALLAAVAEAMAACGAASDAAAEAAGAVGAEAVVSLSVVLGSLTSCEGTPIGTAAPAGACA